MNLEITFTAIIEAIAKLFMLMAAGYILYLKKFINDNFVDTLSLIIVKVIFPALIISKTISNFSYSEYAGWWFFPLSAIAIAVVGLAVATIVRKMWGEEANAREFNASCAFHNCGYLPMNLIMFAFAGSVADRLLIYTFLFILGFNLLMWSLVPLYLEGRLRSGFSMKVFLNPPVVATLFSMIWVAIFGKGSLPSVIIHPMSQLGGASFPLVMITLGAYLCRYRAFIPEGKKMLLSAVAVRLLIVPIIIFPVIYFAGISPDRKFFLFLQSVMPTAVSLVVIGTYTGADNKFLSGTIFYTHLIALITIPLWMGLFSLIVK